MSGEHVHPEYDLEARVAALEAAVYTDTEPPPPEEEPEPPVEGDAMSTVYVNPAGFDTASGESSAPVKTIHEAASRNPATIILDEGRYDFNGMGEIRFKDRMNLLSRHPMRHHQNTTSGVFIANSGPVLASYFRWEAASDVNIYGSNIKGVGFDAAGISEAAVCWHGVNFAEMSGCRLYDPGAGSMKYLLDARTTGSENGNDISWNRFVDNASQRALLLRMESGDGETSNRWNIGRNVFVWTHSATANLTEYAISLTGRGPGGHFLYGNSMEGIPPGQPSGEDQTVGFILLGDNPSNPGGPAVDGCTVIGNQGEASTGPSGAYVDVKSRMNTVMFNRGRFTHKGTVREWQSGGWVEVPEHAAPASGFATVGMQLSELHNLYIITPSAAA